MQSWKEEDLYARVFYNALLAMEITDNKGNIILVNPAWCESLGWTNTEAKSLNVYDIISAEEQQNYAQEIEKLTSGTVSSMRKERRYKRKDGTFFWTDLYSSVLFDDSGKVTGILDIFVNIDMQVISDKVQGELFQSWKT